MRIPRRANSRRSVGLLTAGIVNPCNAKIESHEGIQRLRRSMQSHARLLHQLPHVHLVASESERDIVHGKTGE